MKKHIEDLSFFWDNATCQWLFASKWSDGGWRSSSSRPEQGAKLTEAEAEQEIIGQHLQPLYVVEGMPFRETEELRRMIKKAVKERNDPR